MPIQGYRDRRLPLVLARTVPKGFPSDLAKITRRKLAMLDAAQTIADLREPPANRLEALIGDHKGQHAIRVNDQFRLCFRWTERGPTDVEMVDYH